MKRLHIHLGVDDLAKSVEFYQALFGQEPSKQQDDYAKWMLDDPAVNFAISTRSGNSGIDHLGFQVDSPKDLAQLQSRAAAADRASILDEGETTCCYARSQKHWVVDPQGVPWEHFHTMADARQFGRSAPAEVSRSSSDAGTESSCGCG